MFSMKIPSYVPGVLLLSYILIITFYTPDKSAFSRPPHLLINTDKLPRRQSNHSVYRETMSVRGVPSWQSCPPANSSYAIWSMVASEAEVSYSEGHSGLTRGSGRGIVG